MRHAVIPKILFVIYLLLASIDADAQFKWTFVKGNAEHIWGSYPQPNTIDPKAMPCVRHSAVQFEYNGGLYLFGGRTSATSTYDSYKNDLWRFDTLSNTWILLKGGVVPTTASSGTQGISASTNMPTPRAYGSSWSMGNKMYFFGGSGNAPVNDLWMYDANTNNYTWLKGSIGAYGAATYGTLGVPAAANTPNAREGAISFTYGGYLYLYGGYSNGGGYGAKNDLWRFDTTTNNWTWIKGSSGFGNPGSYGIQNVANASNLPPSGNSNSASWVCNGKFYLYSGGGRDDMWEYDIATNNWTWIKGSTAFSQPTIYGTKGVAAASNTPGGRLSTINWVYNNKLYLYGGDNVNIGNSGNNELWEFDIATKNWRWVSGDSAASYCNYGVLRMPNVLNTPGSRKKSAVWVLGSKVYVAGGLSWLNDKLRNVAVNDLWVYDNVTGLWTWLHGNDNPYNTSMVDIKNLSSEHTYPAGRSAPVSWDFGKDVFIYGGACIAEANERGDAMWHFDVQKNTWELMSGNISDTVIRGTINVASPTNSPGSRIGAVGWKVNNKLYLYGGKTGFYIPGVSIPIYSDLWEYDLATKMWTWIKGADTLGSAGVYGAMGLAAPSNLPSARESAMAWQYGNKLYLFGGWGVDSANREGERNDLWVFDLSTKNWKWLKGNKGYRQNGVYTGAAANLKPGSRSYSGTFTDNGKLYLFGGIGQYTSVFFNSGSLNDLWAFDTTSGNWIFLKGSTDRDDCATFGTLGIPASLNKPGCKTSPYIWKTSTSKIYMCGGSGMLYCSSGGGNLNDIWEYTPSTNNWTWWGGNIVSPTGKYGVAGVPDSANILPGRSAGASWVYNDNLYLMGGGSNTSNHSNFGVGAAATDVWYLQMCTAPPACYGAPVAVLEDTATICNGQSAILNAGNVGYRYLWNTGDTTQFIYANTVGRYWVTITNPLNVSVADTVYVKSVTIASVNLGNDTTICDNATIVIGHTIPNTTNYWSTGDTSHTINVRRSGTYRVTIRLKGTTCYVSDAINISTMPSPVFSLGKDTSICAGDSITLMPINSLSSVKYQWNTSLSDTLNNITTKLGGNYYLNVTGQNGCSATDSFNLGINQLPIVNIGNDTSICKNDTLILSTGVLTTKWTGNITGASIKIFSPNNYIAVVTDTNKCVSSDTISITSAQLPIIDSIVVNSTGGTYTFNASNPKNAVTYIWDFGDGGTSNNSSPIYTYTSNGSYVVVLKVLNICGDTSTYYKTVIVSGLNINKQLALSDEISISPNPTSGIVVVRFLKEHCSDIVIRNNLGITVSKIKDTKSAVLFLDISTYPSGIYHVSILCDNENYTYKLIKQ